MDALLNNKNIFYNKRYRGQIPATVTQFTRRNTTKQGCSPINNTVMVSKMGRAAKPQAGEQHSNNDSL